MTRSALKVIQPVVKFGSRLAPRMAGNLAFRAFCTTPGAARLNGAQAQMATKAQTLLDQAEPLRLAMRRGFVQGYRLVSTEAHSRGTVALVHGWTGRAAFMASFIAPLNQAGFDVVLLDLPGHGRSTGRTLHVPLGVEALHALHRATGPWHGIVAHSFGGALATSFAAGAVAGLPPVVVARQVLIATPHSMPALFRWFGRMIGLSARGQHWFEANVQRVAGNDLASFEIDRMLKCLATQTLVLHAPDDKEVSFASAEAFDAAGPHVRLIPLPGLGHRRIIHVKATVAETVAFLLNRGEA
jgi:pimeloyl-ACP methyl ester carboxylesterase